MPIKVISLNIEGHRHLYERVLPFLQEQQADIINLQEVFAVDVPVIEQALHKQGHFMPMANVTTTSIHQSHALGEWGTCQFFGPEGETTQFRYYLGDDKQPLPIFLENNDSNAMKRGVSWVRGKYEGKLYTIATTHFTWSPEGKTTELQEKTLYQMESILDQLPAFVITGDFNAPRGREIFSELAERYQDNIPPEVMTTIDAQFHKSGKPLQLMVDGFFSTEEYVVSEVRVLEGVSDHKALVGLVERKSSQ